MYLKYLYDVGTDGKLSHDPVFHGTRPYLTLHNPGIYYSQGNEFLRIVWKDGLGSA